MLIHDVAEIVIHHRHEHRRHRIEFVFELHARSGAIEPDFILGKLKIRHRCRSRQRRIREAGAKRRARSRRAVPTARDDHTEAAFRTVDVRIRKTYRRIARAALEIRVQPHGVIENPAGAIERTLGLQVDRAADRVAIHVRRRGLDHLDRLDGRRRNLVDLEGPAGTARGRARHPRAIDRDGIQVGRHAAHGDLKHVSLVALAAETGHLHEQIAEVAIGHIAERVGRHTGLDVVRRALAADGRRLPLAHGGNLEFFQAVDAGIQLYRHRRRRPRHHRDPREALIQARIINDHRLWSGRNPLESERAVRLGEHPQASIRLKRDRCARQRGAGNLMGHLPDDGSGGRRLGQRQGLKETDKYGKEANAQ